MSLQSVKYGGTGIDSYAVGDLLYATGATTLAKLAGVATGNALISGGLATAPSWGKIGLTTHVSGTLPIANGGTGVASLSNDRFPYVTSGAFADSNLYHDGTNVGIGVAPSVALHLKVNSPVIRLQDANGSGNAATNYIEGYDSAGSRDWIIGNRSGSESSLGITCDGDHIWWSSGGTTQQMRLNTSGELLVGTTGDANYTLDVAGDIRIRSTNYLRFDGTGSGDWSSAIRVDGSDHLVINNGRSSADIVFQTNNGSTICTIDGGNDDVHLASGSNFGVGTSSPTVSQTNGIHVASSNAGIRLQNTSASGWGYIEWYDESATGQFIGGYHDGTGTLKWLPGTGLGNTAGLIIDSSGRVAVGTGGTASPSHDLHVQGSSSISTIHIDSTSHRQALITNRDDCVLQIAADDAGSVAAAMILSAQTNTTSAHHWVIESTGTTESHNFSIGYLNTSSSGTNIAGTVTSDFVISTAGYVGVGGVTSPTAYLHAAASTASAASMRMPAGTAPSSSNSGDMWNDSTEKCFVDHPDAVDVLRGGVLYAGTSDAEVVNTTTETTFLPAANKGTLTLPANFFSVGKLLRIIVRGTTSNNTSADLTIRIKIGSTTLASRGYPIGDGVSTGRFSLECIIEAVALGASGTIAAHGSFVHWTGAGNTTTDKVVNLDGASGSTVDTTSSHAIDVTGQWSSADAGSSIKGSVAVVEVLG